MLISSDSALIQPPIIGSQSHLDSVLEISLYTLGFEATYRVIIPAFKDRRKRLQQLAIALLPEDTYEGLQIATDRLLDQQAFATVEALKGNGAEVPHALACPPWTVYHCMSLTPELADALYEAGFRDVDGLDSNGETPLLFDLRGSPSRGSDLLNLCIWFSKKNARITQPAPKRHDNESQMMAAHWLAYRLGNFLKDLFFLEIYMEHEHSLAHLFSIAASEHIHLYWDLVIFLSSLSTFDDCLCSCSSSSGCSPFSKFMQGFIDIIEGPPSWVRIPRHVGHRERRQRIAEWMQEEFLFQHHDHVLLVSRDFIRFETFNELGLTHTCCSYDGSWISQYFRRPCETESRDTREIEHVQLQELEHLVEEFEDEFEKLGQSLPEFLEGYWKTRMAEVLDKSKPVTEEQVRRVEELGVVLRK